MRNKKLVTVVVMSMLLVLAAYSSDNPSTKHVLQDMNPCSDAVLSSNSDYCTYFGGSEQEDATKVTFDNEGNTILIGQTQSNDLPVTDGALQTAYGGGIWDGFVAKFHENGSLLWATYLGGNDYDHVTNINVDSENNIVLTGATWSTDFHVTENAYQSTNRGAADGFITKLSPNGDLIYSTYLGGSGEDWAYGVHFDSEGNILFGGWSNSYGLATAGAYKTAPQGDDIFVAKLSANGSDLQMFTYLGGSGRDQGWSIDVDAYYNIIISGMTTSSNLATTDNALQDDYGGNIDAIYAVVANNGSSLLYLSYIGGNGEDMGAGSNVDSEGNYLLAGMTSSTNLETLNAIQAEYAGGDSDNFVFKLTSEFELEYFTYIGGNETDKCWDARISPEDNIVLVGRTSSEDYPTLNTRHLELSNNFDAFATELSSDGQQIVKSGVYGGLLEDIGEGISIDPEGDVVISGRAESSTIATPGAYQEDYAGNRDVFIFHGIFDAPEMPTITNSSTTTPEYPSNFDNIVLLVLGGAGLCVVIGFVLFLNKKR